MFSDETVLMDSLTRFIAAAPTPLLRSAGGGVSCEFVQFSLGQGKFRGATIHTDIKLWKYPHGGLIKVIQSGKTDSHLRGELGPVA